MNRPVREAHGAEASVRWRLLGAMLSALLMISAFPGNPAPLAVWFCLVPWLLALRGCPRKARGVPHLPMVLSLVFSGLVWMIYLWWPFFEPTMAIAPNKGIAVAFTAIHLFSYMLPFLILGSVHSQFDNGSLFSALILASVITVATFITPTLFIFHLGSLLYEHPLALQLLDLSGTSLLLWCIVLANILVRDILVALWRTRRPLEPGPNMARSLGALVVLSVLVAGYGAVRLFVGPSVDSGSLRIAAIEPNLGARGGSRAMVRDSKQGSATSHIELTRKALRENALRENDRPDLVVWPENSFPVSCDDPVVEKKISGLAAEIGIPIMHQCVDCSSRAERGGCFSQSRYVDRNGVTRFQHSKTKLVPFFEQMQDLPLISRFRDALRRGETYLLRGSEPTLFEHEQARIIPAVCFDAQSPVLLRQGLERGGQLLVVQANYRLFKESKIGLFDLAINIADAVAMRVPMAKISNSGYGAFLQADGRLVPGSITPVYRRGATVHELRLRPRFSLYRRYGDWFIYVAGVMTLYGLSKRVTAR